MSHIDQTSSSSSTSSTTSSTTIQFELLYRYFKNHLTIVPFSYVSLDTNRMTLAYFALAGMDVMGQLDEL